MSSSTEGSSSFSLQTSSGSSEDLGGGAKVLLMKRALPEYEFCLGVRILFMLFRLLLIPEEAPLLEICTLGLKLLYSLLNVNWFAYSGAGLSLLTDLSL